MKLLYIAFFLVYFSSSLEAVQRYPIHMEETETDLQSQVESCLDTVYNDFIAKGGTILRLDENAEPFPLLPGDMVFPSCSGGFNRSQTLWNILRPFADKIILMQPHATQYGFDPYNGCLKWDRVKRNHEYSDEYPLWAGTPKSEKIGWDVFGDFIGKSEPSPEDQKQMSEYYNQYYFHPDVPEGTRRVYITFAKNAHIHLFRLAKTNASLKDVVVLFYPLEDLIHQPPPEWNTEPRSVKAYTEMSRLLTSRLDFSHF